MEVLEDVEEAVEEEGIVLEEMVVLGDLAGGEGPELRVDGVVLLRHGVVGKRSWMTGVELDGWHEARRWV